MSYLNCMCFFIDEPGRQWLNVYPVFFILYILCTSFTKYMFIFISNNIFSSKYGVIKKEIKIICQLEITWRERRTIPAEQPLCVRRGCFGTVIHVTTASGALVLSLLTACRCSAIRACAPHWFYCYKA